MRTISLSCLLGMQIDKNLPMKSISRCQQIKTLITSQLSAEYMWTFQIMNKKKKCSHTYAFKVETQ